MSDSTSQANQTPVQAPAPGPTISPAPDLTPPSRVAEANKKLPLWLLCVAVGFAAALFTRIFPISAPAGPSIVVLNSNALAEAKSAATMEKSQADPNFVAREAQLFGQQVKEIVDSYTKDGIIVMNSYTAIGWPAEADITPQVAKRLGLDLSKRPARPSAVPVTPTAPAVAAPAATPAPAVPNAAPAAQLPPSLRP